MPTFRDFFDAVAHELPALLPGQLRGYRTARMGGVCKVFFDDPALHYELWFRDGGLEVGYHLEGDARAYEPVEAVLRRALPRMRRTLGGQVDLEPFGRGWVHLFEFWPGADRQAETASEASARLSEFMRALEPVLRGPVRSPPKRRR